MIYEKKLLNHPIIFKIKTKMNIELSLYGPKHTHLQNTFEFHQKNIKLDCGKKLVGQHGDNGNCSKWLNKETMLKSESEILYSFTDENFSYISAQVAKAYDEKWLIQES